MQFVIDDDIGNPDKKTMEIKVMDVVYQGARNPSACKKRHKILCAKGARNPAQAGKKIASPKATNYITYFPPGAVDRECAYIVLLLPLLPLLLLLLLLLLLPSSSSPPSF